MTTADSSSPEPLDESVVEQWIARVLDAFNTHDVDRFVTIATDDVVFDHSASPTTMRGLAEVRAFYSANWAAVPDIRLELADGPFLHPHAPKASLLWRVSGTNTGPMNPPGLPPTGKQVELPVCEFAEFRGELICNMSNTDHHRHGRLLGPTRPPSTVVHHHRIAATVIADHELSLAAPLEDPPARPHMKIQARQSAG